jgi:hypothetical protein
MLEPISQEQFKRYFTVKPGPTGSLWERLQRRIVETKWYEDKEKQRIAVVIFDVRDADWQTVTLQDYGGIYATHQVRVSMASEKEAITAVKEMVESESDDCLNKWMEMNRRSIERTGRSLSEHLLKAPVASSRVFSFSLLWGDLKNGATQPRAAVVGRAKEITL